MVREVRRQVDLPASLVDDWDPLLELDIFMASVPEAHTSPRLQRRRRPPLSRSR